MACIKITPIDKFTTLPTFEDDYDFRKLNYVYGTERRSTFDWMNQQMRKNGIVKSYTEELESELDFAILNYQSDPAERRRMFDEMDEELEKNMDPVLSDEHRSLFGKYWKDAFQNWTFKTKGKHGEYYGARENEPFFIFVESQRHPGQEVFDGILRFNKSCTRARAFTEIQKFTRELEVEELKEVEGILFYDVVRNIFRDCKFPMDEDLSMRVGGMFNVFPGWLEKKIQDDAGHPPRSMFRTRPKL